MGYQMADGFDTYGNGFVLASGYPWDLVQGATSSVINTDFRFAPPAGIPGGCWNYPAGSITYIRKNLSGNQTNLIVGFGFKAVTLPTGTADILYFWNNNNFVMGLTLNSAGILQFYLGNGSPPGGGGINLASPIGAASPGATIVAGSWYGIQIQVGFAAGGGGSVACYVNGASTGVINQTGVTTLPGVIASVNQVSIGNTGAQGTGVMRYDDFFCFDNTGGNYNSLQNGDPRFISKLPNGPGFYTNWTPTGLAANWQNAGQAPPLVANYNSNNVGGTKDSYALPVAGLTLPPLLVMTRGSLWKDDANIHTPSLMMRSVSTDVVGTAVPALSGSPLMYDTTFPVDPATSAAWTAPGVDAAQIGVVEG